jgi:hypothetical protein
MQGDTIYLKNRTGPKQRRKKICGKKLTVFLRILLEVSVTMMCLDVKG